MKKNKSNVVSVSRKSLTLCGPGIKGLLEMPFLPETIKDLDVVNLPALLDQVRNFVSSKQITPCDLIMVFGGETYFEKKLATGSDLEMAQTVQDFVDNVPLIHPSSKLFKIGETYTVVVINRRLYESLKTAFETLGFGVKAVVPELALGGVGVTGTEFNLQACRLILKSADFVMANSFTGITPVHESDNWVNNNKKKAVILSLAGIMISVLGVGLIWWQTVASRNAAIAKAKNRKVQTSIATPLPTPIPAVASPSANLADFSVKILNGSGVSGQAGKIAQELKKQGFGNILLGNAPLQSKTLIVLSSKVSPETKAKLTEIFGNVAMVENSQTQFDIQITLGEIAH